MRTQTMTKPKLSKPEKRYLHYVKNALKLHAKVCRTNKCNYGVEIGKEARSINDQAVLRHHVEVCCVVARSPEAPCDCWKLLQNVSCMSATITENASAEIERHLAAIRKIKKTRAPLLGDESYGVYPE